MVSSEKKVGCSSPGLLLEAAEIDAVAGKPGRGAGLEAAHAEALLTQGIGQAVGRILAHAAAGSPCFGAAVHQEPRRKVPVVMTTVVA